MAGSESFDVVIVGGAIVGSSIAYFLARESAGGLKVLVLERDPGYRFCSTGRSLASIRVQFSCPENIAISQFGVEFLRRGPEELEVDGDRPDFTFREHGYLLLATEGGRVVLEENHRVQTAAGGDVALFGPEALRERFPWIRTEGIALGSFGLSGEGWFDAHALMSAFRRKAIALGVAYRHGEAVDLELADGRIAAVRLGGGERIACGALVNAAGPQAGRLAAKAGIALPVFPRKRSVFVFDCRERFERFPLLIDASGVYVRPEGPSFICGWSPPESEDPDCEDFEVDWHLFEDVVWPALAARVPAFEAIKLVNGWAGLYAMNPLDHNAILGAHDEVRNLYFANGFSGHGVQQSPAVGRGIAELIVHGGYRSLDLGLFGFSRFAEGRLIHERNVY